ncbi:helix-turn-helix domain-containing protein [Tissierella pigra]|uniref:Helix-turn-helix transcriptional regulator n=1 Tax=Tissierella pigra TaxID=2607614 RepID=A0A6N7XJN7_9FIRM|nr:helix-turn-helix transcriptional regulator [Tissierella pigra]MSU01796.1 helix-turn-helix transcriptional regulator [Tissierella pigra]
MLGDNIKELMKLKKVTSKELAEIVDVSPTHISYVINNKRYPSVELLEKIADVLEVSVDEFFKDEPIKDEKLQEWKEKYNKQNKLAEQAKYIESIKLDSAEEAMKFILQQPSLMAFGGYDLKEMSEEEIMDLANDLLFAMKLSLEKMNRK